MMALKLLSQWNHCWAALSSLGFPCISSITVQHSVTVERFLRWSSDLLIPAKACFPLKLTVRPNQLNFSLMKSNYSVLSQTKT